MWSYENRLKVLHKHQENRGCWDITDNSTRSRWMQQSKVPYLHRPSNFFQLMEQHIFRNSALRIWGSMDWGSLDLNIRIPPLNHGHPPGVMKFHPNIWSGTEHNLCVRWVKSTDWWSVRRAFTRVYSYFPTFYFVDSPGSLSDYNLHKIMKQKSPYNPIS
jgi:hypothetical protein